MPYFRTEDRCCIYFETQGFESSNPVLVFLNGTLQTTLHWKPNAKALRDRFRILLYDARGQGQSELGQRRLDVETHIDDLSALLHSLDVEKTCLLGVSHGAYLALAYAATSSDAVQGLVLCSLSAVSSSRAALVVKTWIALLNASGLEPMVWAALPVVFGEKYLKEHERILPMIAKSIAGRNTQESVFAQLGAMRGYVPASEWAPRVKASTLVISGSDDPLVPEDGARELSRLCGGRHEQLRDAGHSIPAEAPDWFNKTVREFLSF